MKGLTYLNAHQKADLLWVLQESNKMFDGTLGVYPHKKLHIDIDPNAKPVHSRPYPLPWIHLKIFKKELNHFVRIDVLAAQQESEWVSPSFIIPKKGSRVRWISNLCQLNKVIRRKQHPLPIITDILRKCSGYKFFTKLDVSMQYYKFELDEESQALCTIITPFETPDGTQMLSRHCSSSYGECIVRHWRCWRLHQWCWCFLQWLGPPCQFVSHYITAITWKWLYN